MARSWSWEQASTHPERLDPPPRPRSRPEDLDWMNRYAEAFRKERIELEASLLRLDDLEGDYGVRRVADGVVILQKGAPDDPQARSGLDRLRARSGQGWGRPILRAALTPSSSGRIHRSNSSALISPSTRAASLRLSRCSWACLAMEQARS
jgi:hypothetical protein